MSVTIEDALPATPTNKLLLDVLADAEREVTKLRKLLVVHLCDCRRLSPVLPLEPCQHRLTCTYRRNMNGEPNLALRLPPKAIASADEAQNVMLDRALKLIFKP